MKKNFLIGACISVLLHVSIFGMPKMNFKKPAKELEKCPVVARIPEPKEAKIEEKKPIPEIKQPKKQDMKEVFKPDSVDTDIVPEPTGNIKLEKPSKEYLPALKMDISDYNAIRGAIRYFGMKIALMDKHGNFVEEIDVGSVSRVRPLESGLSEFSNRIRILPSGYFGPRIEWILNMRELKACMLVPAEIDKTFADIQKEAIVKKGYDLKDVKFTNAKFIRSGNRYRLIIKKLYLSPQKGGAI